MKSQTQANKDAQFSTTLILKDVIEKKNIINLKNQQKKTQQITINKKT